ncbi:MAG TPA: RNA polymerase sigma factor [Gemmata sp.]|nr:RNA polymerase sigma factor [Gemmata sp.]
MTEIPPLSVSLRQLGQVLLAGDATALPDAELVGRFIERRDEGAFAALVRRYGTVVFGVCRRVLRHDQDAEDAFQATFLVFARNADRVGRAGAVGNWLYGVACNVARKAKVARHRRAVKEAGAQPRPHTQPVVPDDLREILDAELKALPDKYRAPVVMCDLLGLTTLEAANEVGCPPKTLGTRLIRGRSLLAERLTRRGVAVTAAGLALALGESAKATVSPALMTSTSHLATQFAGGSRAAATPAVAALTKGVTNAMFSVPIKVALVLAGGFLTLVGLHPGSPVHSARAMNESVTVSSAESARPRAVRDDAYAFFRFVHELIGIEGPPVASAQEDKKDEKPVLSGTWVKKDGEPKFEFEKETMRLSPHGDSAVMMLTCEYTIDKDGVVRAKITAHAGKDEVKKVAMQKLPVGTEFTFKWTVNKDACVIEDLKGEKAEAFKSHFEGTYEKK